MVVQRLEGLEAQVLRGPSHFVDVLDLQGEAAVLLLVVRPLQRLLDELEILVKGTQDLDLGPEELVEDVEGMLVLELGLESEKAPTKD